MDCQSDIRGSDALASQINENVLVELQPLQNDAAPLSNLTEAPGENQSVVESEVHAVANEQDGPTPPSAVDTSRHQSDAEEVSTASKELQTMATSPVVAAAAAATDERCDLASLIHKLQQEVSCRSGKATAKAADADRNVLSSHNRVQSKQAVFEYLNGNSNHRPKLPVVKICNALSNFKVTSVGTASTMGVSSGSCQQIQIGPSYSRMSVGTPLQFKSVPSQSLSQKANTDSKAFLTETKRNAGQSGGLTKRRYDDTTTSSENEVKPIKLTLVSPTKLMTDSSSGSSSSSSKEVRSYRIKTESESLADNDSVFTSDKLDSYLNSDQRRQQQQQFSAAVDVDAVDGVTILSFSSLEALQKHIEMGDEYGSMLLPTPGTVCELENGNNSPTGLRKYREHDVADLSDMTFNSLIKNGLLRSLPSSTTRGLLLHLHDAARLADTSLTSRGGSKMWVYRGTEKQPTKGKIYGRRFNGRFVSKARLDYHTKQRTPGPQSAAAAVPFTGTGTNWQSRDDLMGKETKAATKKAVGKSSSSKHATNRGKPSEQFSLVNVSQSMARQAIMALQLAPSMTNSPMKCRKSGSRPTKYSSRVVNTIVEVAGSAPTEGCQPVCKCRSLKIDSVAYQSDDNSLLSPPLPAVADGVTCGQSFCRLGCVCDSIHGYAKLPDKAKRRSHCGRPECMLECSCTHQRSRLRSGRMTLFDRAHGALIEDHRSTDGSVRKSARVKFHPDFSKIEKMNSLIYYDPSIWLANGGGGRSKKRKVDHENDLVDVINDETIKRYQLDDGSMDLDYSKFNGKGENELFGGLNASRHTSCARTSVYKPKPRSKKNAELSSALPSAVKVTIDLTGTTNADEKKPPVAVVKEQKKNLASQGAQNTEDSPFRTHSFLIQTSGPKNSAGVSTENKVFVLEVQSNCVFESRLDSIVRQISSKRQPGQDYPPLGSFVCSGLNVEILPRSAVPVNIPYNKNKPLQSQSQSLFAIRVRITKENSGRPVTSVATGCSETVASDDVASSSVSSSTVGDPNQLPAGISALSNLAVVNTGNAADVDSKPLPSSTATVNSSQLPSSFVGDEMTRLARLAVMQARRGALQRTKPAILGSSRDAVTSSSVTTPTPTIVKTYSTVSPNPTTTVRIIRKSVPNVPGTGSSVAGTGVTISPHPSMLRGATGTVLSRTPRPASVIRPLGQSAILSSVGPVSQSGSTSVANSGSTAETSSSGAAAGTQSSGAVKQQLSKFGILSKVGGSIKLLVRKTPGADSVPDRRKTMQELATGAKAVYVRLPDGKLHRINFATLSKLIATKKNDAAAAAAVVDGVKSILPASGSTATDHTSFTNRSPSGTCGANDGSDSASLSVGSASLTSEACVDNSTDVDSGSLICKIVDVKSTAESEDPADIDATGAGAVDEPNESNMEVVAASCDVDQLSLSKEISNIPNSITEAGDALCVKTSKQTTSEQHLTPDEADPPNHDVEASSSSKSEIHSRSPSVDVVGEDVDAKESVPCLTKPSSPMSKAVENCDGSAVVRNKRKQQMSKRDGTAEFSEYVFFSSNDELKKVPLPINADAGDSLSNKIARERDRRTEITLHVRQLSRVLVQNGCIFQSNSSRKISKLSVINEAINTIASLEQHRDELHREYLMQKKMNLVLRKQLLDLRVRGCCEAVNSAAASSSSTSDVVKVEMAETESPDSSAAASIFDVDGGIRFDAQQFDVSHIKREIDDEHQPAMMDVGASHATGCGSGSRDSGMLRERPGSGNGILEGGCKEVSDAAFDDSTEAKFSGWKVNQEPANTCEQRTVARPASAEAASDPVEDSTKVATDTSDEKDDANKQIPNSLPTMKNAPFKGRPVKAGPATSKLPQMQKQKLIDADKFVVSGQLLKLLTAGFAPPRVNKAEAVATSSAADNN